MLSGQITTWLLHVHDHLLRLNAAAYSLEMSENVGKFIWLICLKVKIGKRFFSVADCELKCDGLSNTLCTMFNECLLLISVRISSRDPPFISPLVKHLLKFRKRLQKRSKPLPIGLEDRINHVIRENQRQAVMRDSYMSGSGSRAWWSTVNIIIGRDTQPQSISSVIHPDTINEYFCNINSDPEYIALPIIDIPEDARIP